MMSLHGACKCSGQVQGMAANDISAVAAEVMFVPIMQGKRSIPGSLEPWEGAVTETEKAVTTGVSPRAGFVLEYWERDVKEVRIKAVWRC